MLWALSFAEAGPSWCLWALARLVWAVELLEQPLLEAAVQGLEWGSLPSSMSVPQAMEWLIEHAEDPSIDAPLPGHTAAAGAESDAPSTSQATAGTSESDEEARDELTDVFKKIRRKREFRADGRVSAGPRVSVQA